MREPERFARNAAHARRDRRDAARDAAATLEHGTHRVKKLVGRRCLGDIALSAGRHRRADGGPVVRRRQHDDRQQRKIAAQLREQIEAVRARQRQVQQHQRAVGMARERGQRLFAVDGRQDVDGTMQRG